jgi:hypothetical protein
MKEILNKTNYAVLIEKITCCQKCFYHSVTDGICGSARWCSHPRNGCSILDHSNRQICDADYKADFPSWCPLKFLT